MADVANSGVAQRHVLDLYPNSVVDSLRRHARKIKEPEFQGHYDEVEIDEFWSFVDRRKQRKCWCRYVWARKERKILAFHIGKRNKSACKALIRKFGNLYTDDFGPYSQELPAEKHIIGKANTTLIERFNRDFRTHIKRLARRIVCHSRDDEMHHDNQHIRSAYISKQYQNDSG